MTTKTKGRAGCHQATQTTTDNQHFTAPTHRITTIDVIKRRIWFFGYDLEETRQLHAASGNFWKQVGVCITLALLRLGRLA